MACIVCALASGLASPVGAQSSAPPPVGNWEISERVVVNGGTSTVHGDVILHRGGVLDIRAATIRLEMPLPAEPTIRVEAGGEFFLNGTGDLRSRLLDGDLDQEDYEQTNYHVRVEVGPKGRFEGRNCTISGVSMHQLYRSSPVNKPAFNAGFRVGGELSLDACTISGSWGGVLVDAGDLRLRRAKFAASGGHDVSVRQGNLAAEDSEFHGDWAITDRGKAVFHRSSMRGENLAHSNAVVNQSSAEVYDSVVAGRSNCLLVSKQSTIVAVNITMEACGQSLSLEDGSVGDLEDARFGQVTSNRPDISIQGSRLRIQNATLHPGMRVELKGEAKLELRNVSVLPMISVVGQGFQARAVGLVRVVAVDERGSPVPGVLVELTNSGHVAFSNRTAWAGVADFWVPFGSHDGNSWVRDAGNWTASANGKHVPVKPSPSNVLLRVKISQSAPESTPGPSLVTLLSFLALLWSARTTVWRPNQRR